MKMLFTFGMIRIPFFGTMILIGILAAMKVLSYDAKRKNLNTEKIYDLVLSAFIGGVIGARTVYVLFYNRSYYLENPIDILKIYEGGLSIHGGLVGGVLFTLIYLKRNREFKILETADLLAPPLILAQGIGRIGCDVYGIVMKNPSFWGIKIGGVAYHPAQIYEAILDYLLFFYLWKKRKNIKYDGQLFGRYLIGFAVIRSTVEIFRDNPKVLGLLSISHILSLILLASGIIWLKIVSKIGKKTVHPQEDKNEHLPYVGFILLLLIFISLGIFYLVQLNL
ncbi:prolipoprotein diacylglyceryl transferase [Ilyobacter sp.]|uniref:prolipoprotein diacylglyceryl transferase n=1 Tax=Ilyobacter sp. TaxID=3100343 RepID=UPI0035650949